MLCIGAAGIFSASTPLALAAQGISEQSYAALQWRLIGPFRGGRVLAVSGVAGDPATFYFGSVDGGVWKSDDAGRTWTPIFDKEPVGSIGALAVAPSDTNVIYVGSGEADMRSDISYGNGVYKSSDAGRTWQRLGLNDTRQIARVVVDPANPKRVFVAALGHAYAANDQRGVFRSIDGGADWQRVLFVDANTGAVDLAMDPRDANHLMAAMWQTRRPPWNIYPPSNGPGSGLFVSRDGGSTWKHVTGHGLPSARLGRMGVAFAPSDPKRVYLIADASQGGLYRSDDGGANWRLVDRDKRLWDRGWYFGGVTVDPKNRDVVYISDTALYRSQNGGVSFSALRGSPDGDDFHTLWIDPTQPARMILGCDQGASISLNDGRTWSSWYNQPTGQFYHLVTDAAFPFVLYGSQQDSDSVAALSRTAYSSLTFRDWRAVLAAGESDMLAPDPEDSDTLFGGRVDRYDMRTSQDQTIDPTLGYPIVEWRETWTLPLVFSQADRRSLYFGRQVLFRTIDGGKTWKIISPDLSRPDPGVPQNLDPTTAADNQGTGPRRGVIYTIAPSPLRAPQIWTGTDDGKIWLTTDSGSHWRDVTPQGLGAWSKVTMLEASWFDTQEAYAAIDRHRLDDQMPYIYRTRDGGATWQLIASDIPDGSYVNAIRSDPQRRGLLYAGTETGPFVSFDDGDSWLPLQLNLPNASVRDLSVRGDSLAIATHGRGFWVLDDLASLRQLNPSVVNASAYLFAPATTVRVRPGDDQGERLPPDEPAAPNPPDGAILDYELQATPSGPLRIQIADAKGKIVRRWSSADRVTPVNPDSYAYMPIYIPHTILPPVAAGLNQFVWDLRYAPLPGLGSTSGNTVVGPWAPPGRYTVLMTVAGKTLRQPLDLVKDPRIAASDADLQAQFALATSIEAWRVKGLAAYDSARAAIASLKKAQQGTVCTPREVAGAIEHLEAIAGSPPPTSPDNSEGYPEINLHSLHALLGGLESLEAEVESADVAPTQDARQAFDVITKLLAAQIHSLPHSVCGQRVI
ncbi:MAG TPA: hypothetical protein VEJ41_05220 [Candidatus Acidoferrales bacterium]|nr:hypothetical protein [Candidatus Acidoferrales bacterium]